MPKVLIPTDADELREMLTDRKVMAQLMADPEQFAEFTEKSVQARIKNDPSIVAQVNEQVQKFQIEWLRNNSTIDSATAARLNLADPTKRGPITTNSRLYNPNALGAKHDGAFDTMADLLLATAGYRDEAASAKLSTLRNALSSAKPSDGGFLIPEVLRAEMLRVALERAVVRSRARVIPMDSLTVPFPMVDSTSNVSSVYGGVVGYWTEEGATLTASQPKFGRVVLRANKLVLYTEVPSELLRDSQPSMEAFISDIFPEALAWFEDVAFTVGSGVGEPLGWMKAPAMVQADRTGSSSGVVVWTDVVNMYARMLPASLDRAVWLVSPDVLPSLLTMTVGAGNAAVWIGGGNFPSGAGSPPMTMLGRPLIVTEKVKPVGTAGDINFVDFGYYLVGDRQTMSVAQSDDFKFNQDMTAFRVIERVDGRPWIQSAITPQNNSSNTLSPFVQLTTA